MLFAVGAKLHIVAQQDDPRDAAQRHYADQLIAGVSPGMEQARVEAKAWVFSTIMLERVDVPELNTLNAYFFAFEPLGVRRRPPPARVRGVEDVGPGASFPGSVDDADFASSLLSGSSDALDVPVIEAGS